MDDEILILEMAQMLLQQLGHDVLLAKDGEEAIELYSKAAGNQEPGGNRHHGPYGPKRHGWKRGGISPS